MILHGYVESTEDNRFYLFENQYTWYMIVGCNKLYASIQGIMIRFGRLETAETHNEILKKSSGSLALMADEDFCG